MNVIAKFGKTQNPKIQSKVYIMAIFSGHLLRFPGGRELLLIRHVYFQLYQD